MRGKLNTIGSRIGTGGRRDGCRGERAAGRTAKRRKEIKGVERKTVDGRFIASCAGADERGVGRDPVYFFVLD